MWRVVAAGLLWIYSASGFAAETPYVVLYRALYPSLKVTEYTHLAAVQRIVSKDPAVLANSIRIEILSKSGTISVDIGADGVTAFPLREDLLAENPMVRSNQPKGSLSVSVSFEIRLSAGNQMSYADLYAGMAEANQALTAVDPSMAGHRVSGLEFSFPPDSGGHIEVIDARREQRLDAGAEGFVRLRNDDALLAATVRWGTRPLRVVPFLASN